MAHRPPRHSGFTLFELLVAIFIAALILGIGSPSFRDFQRNSRLTAVANDFLTVVQLARAEAVKRQQIVSICSSPGASSCSTDPNFAGWIVFEDPNGTCQPASGTAPIRAQAAISPGEAANLSARASVNCLSFGPSGFAYSNPGPALDQHVLVCDRRGILLPGVGQSIARGVVLTATGRAWITRDASMIQPWGLPCPPAGQ